MSQQSPIGPGDYYVNQNQDWFNSSDMINQLNNASGNWGKNQVARKAFPTFFGSVLYEGYGNYEYETKFPGRKSVFLDHSYDPLEKYRQDKPPRIGQLEKLYKDAHRLMSTGRNCGKRFAWSQFLEDPFMMKQISPGGLFVSDDIASMVKAKQSKEDDGVDAWIERDMRNWINEIPLITREETDLEATQKMFKTAKFYRSDNGEAPIHWGNKRGSVAYETVADGKTTLTVTFPEASKIVYHFDHNGKLQDVINTQPVQPPHPSKPHEEHCMLEPVYAHAFGGPRYEAVRRKAWAKMNGTPA